jgi:gamma-glutamyltranspeptidase/glutathione hydrolase
MAPPSSGGLVVLQSLAVLEVSDHRAMQAATAPWIRTLVHALTHAFADRAAYGGDPEFVELPMTELLDPGLASALLAVTPEAGPVPTWEAGLSGLRGETKARVGDDGGTSHLSVLDGEGNAVALTTTVNLHFGSLQADPITGVVLNDEMDDFTARPGKPNAFGLVQGTANAPGPGKRPLSSMTPTLVVDPEGHVLLAVGAAGGPRIITATLQILLGVVDRNLTVEGALAAPRVHAQWMPEEVRFEPGMPAAALESLRAEGFSFAESSHLATAQAVSFDPATGTFAAAADPRSGGAWRVVKAGEPVPPAPRSEP